jgi:Ni/Co efflux regulator RcnB
MVCVPIFFIFPLKQVAHGMRYTIAPCRFGQIIDMKMSCALVFVIVGILAVGQAKADKPSWAGGGKGAKTEHQEEWDDDSERRLQRDGYHRSSRGRVRVTTRSDVHFDDRQRKIARDYFKKQFHRGHCPLGLAKKHNGCMPLGKAKKWSIGRQLPHDVSYFELPSTLVLQFGPPPTGHHYVRVANDILLVALGTELLIDAIRDVGRI